MRKRFRDISLLSPLIFLFYVLPSRAQQQQQSIEELTKQIEALTQTVKAMQKDLQDIKAMLQSRIPTPPPENVLLDLRGHPSRGDSTAKLTLIEFSDYQ